MFQAPFITIMNMETWNSLPPEYQAVFEEWSGVDASLKFAEMWDQTADQNMQELLATRCRSRIISGGSQPLPAGGLIPYADSWADDIPRIPFDALAYFQACQEAYDKIRRMRGARCQIRKNRRGFSRGCNNRRFCLASCPCWYHLHGYEYRHGSDGRWLLGLPL